MKENESVGRRMSRVFSPPFLVLRSGFFLVMVLACTRPALADEETLPLPEPSQKQVDFVKDVQPLFQGKCLACHGPEEEEGGFRLDMGARALEGGDSGQAILPGNSLESSLIHRLAGVDEDERMPPEDEGTPLTDEEISIVRAWIDQGAHWPRSADADKVAENHWSFAPIANPELPDIDHQGFVNNGIDAFILHRLEAEGITLSPEANRSDLIRRVHLDLTGLLPSPDEVQKWLDDAREDWYPNLVDQLLASPHYGERWARHWLDLARYADSDGYEKDMPRPHAWRWRQWVIDALNDNMPFDQFTIEQLAGDLLPDGSLDQQIATGFNRNTLVNREGGTDPEEDRVKRTVDRINTVGNVWLGLTVECAQCHSHKYDPLRQKEYYQLFAFFNSLSEPDVGAPLPQQRQEYEVAMKNFNEERKPFQTAVDQYDENQLDAAMNAWEASGPSEELAWTILTPKSIKSKKGSTLELLEDGSVFASGEHPGRQEIYTLEFDTELTDITGFRVEMLSDSRLPGNGPGRGPLGNFHLTRFDVDVAPLDALETLDDSKPLEPVRVELIKTNASFSETGHPVAKAITATPTNGWSIAPQMGKPHFATFKSKTPFGFKRGTRITIAMWQSSVLRHFHSVGRFRISVSTKVNEKPLPLGGMTNRVASTLARKSSHRSAEEIEELRGYYKTIDPQRIELEKALDEQREKAPSNPFLATKAQVVQQLRTPRKTHFLLRGDFLAPDYEVFAGTPDVLPPLVPRGETPDRLDLARWLLDSRNPMTARVTVNRIWARYFGRGIVSTLKDFGTQGAPPTHPELLDWLATQFRQSGWNLKQLHRLIVTSSTYRQSSHNRPELSERDPLNEWLSHQNRLRVEGEIVRDAALTASGLIKLKVGGPSVRPPQPKEIAGLGYANQVKWQTSEGEDRYRRGLYTFFQRTVPYPMLITFDSPDSNVSCVRRNRSNTPLQALTLWNDPVFHECSQALGKRIVQHETTTGLAPDDGPHNVIDRRMEFSFLASLGRLPDEQDREALLQFLEMQTRILKTDIPASQIDCRGLTRWPINLPSSWQCWTTVARTLLNLDEFVTRP